MKLRPVRGRLEGWGPLIFALVGAAVVHLIWGLFCLLAMAASEMREIVERRITMAQARIDEDQLAAEMLKGRGGRL